MNHFEYVSVAVALVFSLAIARLLGGLPHTSARGRGAVLPLVFNVAMILAGMTSWWITWRFKDVEWTPLGFAWILAVPGFLYLRAAILLTDNPGQIASWDEQYWGARRRFFGVGMAAGVHSAFLPWVVGAIDWFTPAAIHTGTLVILLACAIGIWSESRRVHLALALLYIALPVLYLFLTPTNL